MSAEQMILKPVGRVCAGEEGFFLQIDEPYRQALTAIEGFSHLNVLWWADQVDDPELRSITVCDKPYVKAPERMGIFATRSPMRPNPIALSAVSVLSVDIERGIVRIPWMDAEPGTPVVDIKPYHPAVDRIRELSVPDWCAHWPEWMEDSMSFDWAGEFVNAR